MIVLYGYFGNLSQSFSKLLKEIFKGRAYLEFKGTGKSYLFTTLFYLVFSKQAGKGKESENSFLVSVASAMKKVGKIGKYMMIDKALQGIVIVEGKFCYGT